MPTGTLTNPALAQQLLDALDALFGLHPGYRPAHAKGLMCSGDGGSAQVNLLQLRDITNTPEPTSLCAMGLGALCLLARRRRQA